MKPTLFAAPCVLTMSGIDSAGTAVCWAAAQLTARTIGTHGANPDAAKRIRSARWRDGSVASRRCSRAVSHTPAVMRTAPPTWKTAARVKKPAATIGGAVIVSKIADRRRVAVARVSAPTPAYK